MTTSRSRGKKITVPSSRKNRLNRQLLRYKKTLRRYRIIWTPLLRVPLRPSSIPTSSRKRHSRKQNLLPRPKPIPQQDKRISLQLTMKKRQKRMIQKLLMRINSLRKHRQEPRKNRLKLKRKQRRRLKRKHRLSKKILTLPLKLLLFLNNMQIH